MSFVLPLVLTAFLPFLAWSQTAGLVYSRVLPVLLSGITTSGIVSAIAVDAAGNTSAAVRGDGHTFPTTPGGPFGDSIPASVFLAKINPATGLLYSYLIPGLSGKVTLALDAQGEPFRARVESRWAS